MLKHHIAFRDHVAQLDDVDLGEVIIEVSYERRIDALTKRLEKLNDVSLRLQQQKCTMRQGMSYFDSVLDFCLILDARLIPHARIVRILFFF